LYKYPELNDKSYLLEDYPKDLILRTGTHLSRPEERIQHFKNFLEEKEKNTIRIGTFGDSHTYGSEVEKTESYPYQLQQMFLEKDPQRKIEVLNFGEGGASFQEQFFLWETYRKKYHLDYILIGPKGVYPDRDSTFRMNFDNSLNYPKHRFILEDNSVKEVFINPTEFEEDLLKKRFRNYYSLIPSLKALRYDKKPFQIWEFLFPFLRDKLISPFYYTSLPEWEEIFKINKILLEKIKKEYDKKILLFLKEKKHFRLYKSVKDKYNFNEIHYIVDNFYTMFSHHSSLGNEYIANFFFNALLGKKSFSFNRIKCFFSPKNKAEKNLPKLDLSLVNRIQVFQGDTLLSVLNKNIPSLKDNSYEEDKLKNTKHFISFTNMNHLLRGPFFPVSFPLKEGQKLYLKLDSKNTIELGKIRNLDSHHKFFIFHADYINNSQIILSYYYGYKNYFKVTNLPSEIKRAVKKQKHSIDLFIEKNKIGSLYPYSYKNDKIFYFLSKKHNKKSFLMMGASSDFVREKNFKEEFSPTMVYTMEDETKIKSLMSVKCKKVPYKIKLELPHFDPIKLN